MSKTKKTDVTIKEEYLLPSRGKMYSKQFDPHVELRSMTVAEEMKRLTRTDHPYKMMSDIIEDCLLTELPVPVYELCLPDYIYLLHKMRVVTYGTKYSNQYFCPHCNTVQSVEVDLDSLKVKPYDDSIEKDKHIVLPVSKREIVLRFQTPRDLDAIEEKKKEILEKNPDADDPTSILNIASFIDTIDGKPLDAIFGLDIIKKLPAADGLYLAQKAIELQEKVGIDTVVMAHCKCGNDVKTTFRYSPEFFRPTFD